jgi:hypothetical protein
VSTAELLLPVWFAADLAPAAALLFAAASQLSNMELTKQQGNVMAALKQGNDALKQAQQEVSSTEQQLTAAI